MEDNFTSNTMQNQYIVYGSNVWNLRFRVLCFEFRQTEVQL